jgi:hypothetical protein
MNLFRWEAPTSASGSTLKVNFAFFFPVVSDGFFDFYIELSSFDIDFLDSTSSIDSC